jgi:hypothetical protein
MAEPQTNHASILDAQCERAIPAASTRLSYESRDRRHASFNASRVAASRLTLTIPADHGRRTMDGDAETHKARPLADLYCRRSHGYCLSAPMRMSKRRIGLRQVCPARIRTSLDGRFATSDYNAA